jgi:hypothetical protein
MRVRATAEERHKVAPSLETLQERLELFKRAQKESRTSDAENLPKRQAIIEYSKKQIESTKKDLEKEMGDQVSKRLAKMKRALDVQSANLSKAQTDGETQEVIAKLQKNVLGWSRALKIAKKDLKQMWTDDLAAQSKRLAAVEGKVDRLAARVAVLEEMGKQDGVTVRVIVSDEEAAAKKANDDLEDDEKVERRVQGVAKARDATEKAESKRDAKLRERAQILTQIELELDQLQTVVLRCKQEEQLADKNLQVLLTHMSYKANKEEAKEAKEGSQCASPSALKPSLDQTEPRLESELTPADNVMAAQAATAAGGSSRSSSGGSSKQAKPAKLLHRQPQAKGTALKFTAGGNLPHFSVSHTPPC